MKQLTQKETNDILDFFKNQVKEDGELNMDEIAQYEGSINLMNPLHIKEFFSKTDNKQYNDKYWKAIVKKWEGVSKPKFKKVTLNIEQIPPSVPLPPVVDASKFKQKTISFNPPPSPKEDSNAKLKKRQQAMKDKLKKINDETPTPQPKKITSPNGFGAFETYMLLRIQPDKDNEANNLIKMLERNFIERGFNEKTTKEIKKILKLAKYKDLVIESAIQERINNPVAPISPSEVPSEVPQAKKRGRPKKKKIEPGSNKLVLVDNIIKQSNMTTKLLKEYYDFVFENESQ